MSIDIKTVSRIAELARLEFDAAEKEKILADLNRMLAFVDRLGEIHTEGVEPLVFMTDRENVYRDDVAVSSTTQEEALMNAPRKDMYYFRVPKVIK
jgi:aspartyl-tRNA(Asn)/glutamyl-tRNA(Gln) amidotransferase subunit C